MPGTVLWFNFTAHSPSDTTDPEGDITYLPYLSVGRNILYVEGVDWTKETLDCLFQVVRFRH